MKRGDDYADNLTEAERRTLDRLLQTVSTPEHVPAMINGRLVELPVDPGRDRPRTARSGRPRVALAAAAVAVIALAAAFIPSVVPGIRPGWLPTLHGPPPPAPAQRSTVDVVAGLAGAAGREAVTRPSTQDVLVVVASRDGDRCRNNGYQVDLGLAAAGPDDLPAVKLDITGISTVVGPPSRVPCGDNQAPAGPADGQPSTKIFSFDLPATALVWSDLVRKLASSGTPLPDLLDPRTLPSGLDIRMLSLAPDSLGPFMAKQALIQPAGDAAWWTAVMPLLCSPLASPALRSAALTLAADRLAGVTLVTEHGYDLLGRAGPVLRVPYAVGGLATTADLTFDPETGALWQRTVYAPAGLGWTAMSSAYR
jgi:hypothetical protein